MNATAGVPRNYPRPSAVPRPYETRRTAESVAAHFRTLRFFTRRGDPYVYRCDACGVWHVGLDTGARWHSCRDRHDNYLSFIGDRSESEAA